MDILTKRILSDREKSEHRIFEIEHSINHCTASIRAIANGASAIEMLRLLPEKLEDLKVNNVWLHEEQSRVQMMDSYLSFNSHSPHGK